MIVWPPKLEEGYGRAVNCDLRKLLGFTGLEYDYY
jgi:hypothetical protein